MRNMAGIFVMIILFNGCRKDHHPLVEIYELKSYSTTVDPSGYPAIVSINNAVLQNRPLVSDQNIIHYTRATTTFKLTSGIGSVINNYGSDKAFAVTVDKRPVYYGTFHPGYLSYIAFGVATIDPILNNGYELKIDFPAIPGNTYLQQFDKRNDDQILDVLLETGRLQ